MSIEKMHSVLIALVASVVTCVVTNDAQAQSSTRGGYSSPTMSAPMSSGPTYSAPMRSQSVQSPQVYSSGGSSFGVSGGAPSYASNAPIAVGSGCSGPGCAGSVVMSARPVIISSPQYQSYSNQPVYSSAYRGYPQASPRVQYQSSYAPMTTYRYPQRSSGHCR